MKTLPINKILTSADSWVGYGAVCVRVEVHIRPPSKNTKTFISKTVRENRVID